MVATTVTGANGGNGGNGNADNGSGQTTTTTVTSGGTFLLSDTTRQGIMDGRDLVISTFPVIQSQTGGRGHWVVLSNLLTSVKPHVLNAGAVARLTDFSLPSTGLVRIDDLRVAPPAPTLSPAITSAADTALQALVENVAAFYPAINNWANTNLINSHLGHLVVRDALVERIAPCNGCDALSLSAEQAFGRGTKGACRPPAALQAILNADPMTTTGRTPLDGLLGPCFHIMQENYSRTRRGFAVVAFTAVIAVGFTLGGNNARAQGGGCSVGAFQAAPTLGAFIGSLQAAGTSVAGCANVLRLVYVNNLFILTPQAYEQMIAAAGSQSGGNGGSNGNGGNGDNPSNGNGAPGSSGGNGSGQVVTKNVTTGLPPIATINDATLDANIRASAAQGEAVALAPNFPFARQMSAESFFLVAAPSNGNSNFSGTTQALNAAIVSVFSRYIAVVSFPEGTGLAEAYTVVTPEVTLAASNLHAQAISAFQNFGNHAIGIAQIPLSDALIDAIDESLKDNRVTVTTSSRTPPMGF